MPLVIETNSKPRKKSKISEEGKTLKDIRETLPSHTVEIELNVMEDQRRRLLKINEHLRVIRNTVLHQVKKNYDQMIRTKEYKRLNKQYKKVLEQLKKETNKETKKSLEKQKKQLGKKYAELQKKYNVTFEYIRKYGIQLRTKYFTLPDAVTVLSVCESVWESIEELLYGKASKVRFYRRHQFVTFQGKQAERCIILKNKNDRFYVQFAKMKFPLIIKKNDLFIEETLSNICYYVKNADAIDKENIERYRSGYELRSTYRIRNNRIVCKEIRGKKRFFVQIVLEGLPVPKRKKDGSFRHSLGTGKVAVDVGTQSFAVVSEKDVYLKNLAERSRKTFRLENKIRLIQRYLDRSRRAMNPNNYDKDGKVIKGPKQWVLSNRYKKMAKVLRNLHRIAAMNRRYAHNEEVNKLRSLGNVIIIEKMNIQALQKKKKEVTKNEKTGKFHRRKRFGKSILKRSPGYFIKQAKYKFESTGGTFNEVNTWSFKASQYDHVLGCANKKQLSQRWHMLPDGTKIQRDLYSAFLLYCSNNDLSEPEQALCHQYFPRFFKLHNECIEQIKKERRIVLNSGIKFN